MEEAINAATSSGQRPSISQISVMTGMQRLAVTELQNRQRQDEQVRQVNPTMKIIGAWQTSAKYLTSKGKPRVLATLGRDSEFAQLVRSVSKDPNPYTILQEMERSGMVERTKTGVKLKMASLLSNGDAELGLSFLAEDLADLCYTVTDNINALDEKPHHHLTTEYDAIPASKFAMVQDLFLEEGHKLHERLRKQLAEIDLPGDRTDSNEEEVVRVMFCSFSRVDRSSTNEEAL